MKVLGDISFGSPQWKVTLPEPSSLIQSEHFPLMLLTWPSNWDGDGWASHALIQLLNHLHLVCPSQCLLK